MNYASIITSPIGKITILADDEFVHGITFAETDITGFTENQLTVKVAQQLGDYFDGKLQHFNFPIKQNGTKFQQEVWQNLLNIPFGETVSYAKFSAHHPLPPPISYTGYCSCKRKKQYSCCSALP